MEAASRGVLLELVMLLGGLEIGPDFAGGMSKEPAGRGLRGAAFKVEIPTGCGTSFMPQPARSSNPMAPEEPGRPPGDMVGDLPVSLPLAGSRARELRLSPPGSVGGSSGCLKGLVRGWPVSDGAPAREARPLREMLGPLSSSKPTALADLPRLLVPALKPGGTIPTFAPLP